MSGVAVLFAREDSVYKQMRGCDVYDIKRDARTWSGGRPVVAHPPCRAWGRLRQFAKPRDDEKALALFAVAQVRKHGGVLEHPANSTLWGAATLPAPGVRDQYGGWTLPIYQGHFGHRAPKATWLYIVGCEPKDIPALPFVLGLPEGRVELLSRAAREHTPEPLAAWLVELAARCAK
ncbi:hypothetical protein [Vogesella indigofera]|uniref:hypothetical protein n=1 Tax=Vogesella indigofera TaxID=45465 RepID=UPI001B8814FB|nr:hypothetical protein [Vogesella indigofera]